MYNHIHLLTLLLAPVMAYLAAALVFSVIESRRSSSHAVPVNNANIQYHDGQHL
jgi:Tfp pilus assembly protein FimT